MFNSTEFLKIMDGTLSVQVAIDKHISGTFILKDAYLPD
jgi:hypothetical protein